MVKDTGRLVSASRAYSNGMLKSLTYVKEVINVEITYQEVLSRGIY